MTRDKRKTTILCMAGPGCPVKGREDLLKRNGYEVLPARDIDEVLALLAKGRPADIIILRGNPEKALPLIEKNIPLIYLISGEGMSPGEMDALPSHCSLMPADCSDGFLLSVLRLAQKRTEEAGITRESEHRYRDILESLTEVIYETDSKGVFTYLSPSVREVLGYSPEEGLGRNFLDFVFEEDRERLLNRFLHFSKGEPITHEDFRIVSQSGEVRWIHTRGRLLLKGGRFIGSRGVIIDTTESKRSEDSLQKYKFMVDEAGDEIYLVQHDGSLAYVNRAAAESLGYTVKEMLDLGIPGFDLHIGPDYQRHFEKVKSGPYPPFETVQMTKDGRRLIKEIKSVYIRLGGKEYVFGFGRDITARKKTEEITYEKNRFFETLISNLPGLVYRCRNDRDWTMEYIGGQCREITGYEPEDIIGNRVLSFNDLIEEEHRERVWNHWQDILSRREVFRDEYTIRSADGSVKWVWEQGTGVFDPSGKLLGLEGFITEVTERKKAEQRLRFQSILLDQIGDLITATDLEGRITYVNQAVCRSLDLPREEIVGRNILMYGGNTRHAEQQRTILETTLREGEWRGEIVNIGKHGQEIILDSRVWKVRDNTGKVVALCSISTDITGKKRAEEDLLKTRALFQAALNQSPVGIQIADAPDIRLCMANESAERITGVSAEDQMTISLDNLQAVTWRLLRPDGTPYSFPEYPFIRTIQNGEIIRNEEMWVERADGERFYISTNAAPIRDEEGRIIAGIVVYPDITERKKTEEALALSESRFRFLTENMGDIAYILDMDLRTVYVSPSVKRILGYTPEERMRQMAREQLTPKSLDEAAGRLAEYLEQEGTEKADPNLTIVMELEYYHKDGSLVTLETILRALRDKDGKMTGIYGLGRDISERKKAEEERLEMERRLLHSQKLESLGVLAGGIAHDFNNLLTAIIGNLDLALLNISPLAASRTDIDQAMRAARSAAELTRQMLAYSGKGRFEVREISLNDLVEENVHMLKAAVPHTITLQMHLGQDIPSFEADPSQIQQVIMNLITNASEAIGETAGIINLRTGCLDYSEEELAASYIEGKPAPGSYVFLEVSDTGSGMDPATLERLFDPFFTTKFTGRGLGLPVVQGVVRGHGGAVFVESEPGRGTAIRVIFPAGNNRKSPVQKARREEIPRGTKKTNASAKGTVLVVDDEEMVRTLCQRIVSTLGFSALTACDGQECLDLFTSHAGEICCVILDLTMPRMDGFTTFGELKKIDPRVRVILSSGYDEQEATRRFAGQDLAGFIEKPYRLENVRQMLDRILPGPHSD